MVLEVWDARRAEKLQRRTFDMGGAWLDRWLAEGAVLQLRDRDSGSLRVDVAAGRLLEVEGRVVDGDCRLEPGMEDALWEMLGSAG